MPEGDPRGREHDYGGEAGREGNSHGEHDALWWLKTHRRTADSTRSVAPIRPRRGPRFASASQAVFTIVSAFLGALIAGCRPRANLVVEILVLRQQLAVLKRRRPRAQLRPIDRAFWVVVSRVWSRWGDALTIVKPATVVTWHRRGFARFWAWKSRRVRRPPLAPELVALIVRMARENPLWSRRRIANELAKLGHDLGKDAVAKYMPRPASHPPR